MLSGEHQLVSTCFFKRNWKFRSQALGLPQLFKRGSNCPPLHVCREWRDFWNCSAVTEGPPPYSSLVSLGGGRDHKGLVSKTSSKLRAWHTGTGTQVCQSSAWSVLDRTGPGVIVVSPSWSTCVPIPTVDNLGSEDELLDDSFTGHSGQSLFTAKLRGLGLAACSCQVPEVHSCVPCGAVNRAAWTM